MYSKLFVQPGSAKEWMFILKESNRIEHIYVYIYMKMKKLKTKNNRHLFNLWENDLEQDTIATDTGKQRKLRNQKTQ